MRRKETGIIFPASAHSNTRSQCLTNSLPGLQVKPGPYIRRHRTRYRDQKDHYAEADYLGDGLTPEEMAARLDEIAVELDSDLVLLVRRPAPAFVARGEVVAILPEVQFWYSETLSVYRWPSPTEGSAPR